MAVCLTYVFAVLQHFQGVALPRVLSYGGGRGALFLSPSLFLLFFQHLRPHFGVFHGPLLIFTLGCFFPHFQTRALG